MQLMYQLLQASLENLLYPKDAMPLYPFIKQVCTHNSSLCMRLTEMVSLRHFLFQFSLFMWNGLRFTHVAIKKIQILTTISVCFSTLSIYMCVCIHIYIYMFTHIRTCWLKSRLSYEWICLSHLLWKHEESFCRGLYNGNLNWSIFHYH
jgi:hypothetical protein